MNVKNNLEKINNDIKNICQKSGRNFEDITLIAVDVYKRQFQRLSMVIMLLVKL